MSKDKVREFWIHNFPTNEVTPWENEPVAYRKYSNVVDLPGGFWPEKHTIHVVEMSYATKLEKQIRTLFDEIKHGDQEHQEWLKKKIEEHFEIKLKDGE